MNSVQFERRLNQPGWLKLAVPVCSVIAALVPMSVLLAATGHPVWSTYDQLVWSGFLGGGELTSTLTFATPLLFTGLAAAAAFRMRLFNIGAEGQLYFGVVGAAGVGLALAGKPSFLVIAAMALAGIAGGTLWALIPGLLRAYARTNEVLTTLMLNYVAGLVLNYLILDSTSYWRDMSNPTFPQSKALTSTAVWPSWGTGLVVPLGLPICLVAAAGLWWLYRHTRFGFEVQVIGDSPENAHYAGMNIKRKILAVMCISGGVAGLGGASEIGDFTQQLDPTGLQQSSFGYNGIAVAALARYNPLAVVVAALLFGGLQSAGYSLQGADFPSGLVGVLQGMILYCVLGGEILVHHRLRWHRPPRAVAPQLKEAVDEQ